MEMKYYIVGLFVLLGVLFSCGEKTNKPSDNFDRTESLTFIADEIIIPSWENYQKSLNDFVKAKNEFVQSRTTASLQNLRLKFKESWLAWQDVSMFEIGKGEKLAIRNFSNLYPTDPSLITELVDSDNRNLELPSTYTAQGFPAIDFLLYGILESDEDLLILFEQDSYSNYLSELIDRLSALANQVVQDWQGSYRLEFISNNGSSATSSYDMLVNDFLFYYERYLRAGKVGIPSGAFTTSELPDRVESFYAKEINKDLFDRALKTCINFFNGISFDGLTSGQSLSSYITYIQQLNSQSDIVEVVNSNWNNTLSKSEEVSSDFISQIETNNIKMRELYDALQSNVILLKVDMLQALNIQVDFVDADGD